MMSKFYKLGALMALGALIMPSVPVKAEKGAPHTLEASANYDKVSLTWKSPESVKRVQWHNNYAYNGNEGRQATAEGPAYIHIASRFDKEDLKPLVGQMIESVVYYEYRPVISVTAMIYENGKLVSEQPADLSGFKADTERAIKLVTPYVIKADTELMVALKIVHGTNLNFVAIKDNAPNPKGDLYSFNGKDWKHAGDGTFLISMILKNTVDEAPAGYNIYADGTKVNSAPVTETTYILPGQTDGTHGYVVAAVYGSEEFKTYQANVKVKGVNSYFPSAASMAVETEDLDALIEWTAPLVRKADNSLTWTKGQLGNAIGGTASSNTKVWIKNEFDASDLVSYAGCSIKSISTKFHDTSTQSLKLFVIKNGVIDYFEDVPAEKISQIKVDEMISFPLTTPYVLENGNKYAYGLYVLQTPKGKPISVDNGQAVNGKGNSFSTSSPSSTGFEKSKPSWKTLAQGNIAGNWLMTAEVTAPGAYAETLTGYNLYRDGTLLASNLKDNLYLDEVPAPGTYEYSVEAIGTNNKTSALTTAKANFKLPDYYRAPLMGETDFDASKQTVSLQWGMDVELKHCGEPTYKVGFDEDMNLCYGSKFTAAELAPYKNYTINSLKFVIGQALPAGFKLEIYNGAGTVLSSTEIEAGAVNPLALYTLKLTKPVTITGEEDLILAYNAVIPKGVEPIVLDNGPLVSGGAVVKFAGMNTWMNLGTVQSDYNKYNIIISAIASEPTANPTSVQMASIELGKACENTLTSGRIAVADLKSPYGVDAVMATANAGGTNFEPVSFNVYRNGVLVTNIKEKKYTDRLSDYGNFSYAVTAVYANGWESPSSTEVTVNNLIPQLAEAPFNLDGEIAGNDLRLSWQTADQASRLSYEDVASASYGVGMTGSSTRETFAVIKFTAEELTPYKDNELTHIRFGLYSNDLKSASVVVFEGFNIIYEQEVDLSTLVTAKDGFNLIRLNKPYRITGKNDVMIGYHITYANGIKPMLCDAGPAIDGKGNLMSASGSHTSWKTLKSLSSALNYNWRITGILRHPATSASKAPQLADEAPVTYNVYCDGTAVKKNVSGTSVTVENASNGIYTVTCVKDSKESSPSNELRVSGLSGIESAVSGGDARYDAPTRSLILPAEGNVTVYSASGVAVRKASEVTILDLSDLVPGVYIAICSNGTCIKFTR